MEAIILAGGFGTRLSHIVSNVPKPMAPVADRPFLEYIIDNLNDNGFQKAVLAVGYKRESIIEHFGNQYKNINLIYSTEDEPLGTGGAVKKALDFCSDESVFILNGDTFAEVDYKAMAQYHQDNKSELTVAVKMMRDFQRYGTVNFQEGRIISFLEKKPMESGYINTGVYIMNRRFLQDFTEKKFSFESDVMEKHVNDKKIFAFETSGYFIDIGVPEDYYQAQSDFKSRFSSMNKAIFFDRDGTINVEKNYLYKPEDFEFISGIPQLIKKYNDEGYLVIVVTNQAGIARGYYTEEDMHKLHNYINDRLKEYGAHIDAFYFCPHHPEYGIGKYKVDCNCRKPKTGMLENAIRDFQIDPSQSIMIGDKPWDIEAGERMGIKGIYIRDVLINRI